MFGFVSFVALLSLTLVHGDIDKDIRNACDRDIKIVAACKTMTPNRFYIFEEKKAWLYDAGEQKLLEYHDIESKVKDPILSASMILDCSSEKPSFQIGRIITEKQTFEFTNFKDYSAWEEKATNEAIDTVGSACVHEDQMNVKYVHKYIRPKTLEYCEGDKPCINSTTWGIHPPFSTDKAIKELPSFPDALAFEFDGQKKDQKVLFAYNNMIFYSVQDNENEWRTKEIDVQSLFGCKSVLMTVVYAGLAVVVFVVILGAVSGVLTVIKRRTKVEEDEDNNTLTAGKGKSPPKVVNK